MYKANRFQAKCYTQHDVECNQKYNDTLPYSFHLKMVRAQFEVFKNLLSFEEQEIAAAGCAGHDLIEDARENFNSVLNKALDSGFSNPEAHKIANIVILCTEFSRGKSRAERKPDEFYIALQGDKLAAFVKLCDIIANSLFSCLSNSSMFEKYKKEFPKLEQHMAVHTDLLPMLVYLQKIYSL